MMENAGGMKRKLKIMDTVAFQYPIFWKKKDRITIEQIQTGW